MSVSRVDSRDEFGHTPLMRAAMQNDVHVLEILLGNGADINAQNSYGNTALSMAAQRGHSAAIQVLIDNKVDINLQSKDGWTALMAASQNSHVKAVETLLKGGADANLQRSNGGTALKICAHSGPKSEGCPVIAELLINAGADEFPHMPAWMTPLFLKRAEAIAEIALDQQATSASAIASLIASYDSTAATDLVRRRLSQ